MAEFKDLPVEIRSEIWAECLSNADRQGIYFFDPEDFGIKDEGEDDQADRDWEVEREVIVAFPTIMHLCHESREYVKSRLSFREDTVRSINVPCRPYRPEKDAFFVPHRHFDDFMAAFRKAQEDEYNGVLQEGTNAFCRDIAHLALSSPILLEYDEGTLGYLIPEMTALRLLSFVFGNTDTLDLSKPLAMGGLDRDRAEAIPGEPRTKIHVEETLDDLWGEASMWELPDESKAPWSETTGRWLFDLEGNMIERVRGLV